VRRPQIKLAKLVAQQAPVNTSVYHAPPPPSDFKAQKGSNTLADILPDMTALRIQGAMSRTRGGMYSDRLPIEGDAVVTLGLDFGTAYTKAVVRQGGRHFLVDWSDAVETDCKFLMPSVFSEGPDGTLVVGTRCGEGWQVHDGLKMHLLTEANEPARARATAFVALALRHAGAWFLRRFGTNLKRTYAWRLHLGAPTASWEDNETQQVFRNVAAAAKGLATGSKPITLASALDVLDHQPQNRSHGISVLPEFACQLFSYFNSASRQSDIHAMLDVGAGTLDVAFFNVHGDEDGNCLPVFSNGTHNRGTHYLIGALAGRRGGPPVIWTDGDCAAPDERFAKVLGEGKDEVADRRNIYLRAVAHAFDIARNGARDKYVTSPVWRRGQPLVLFLCGGGSHIPCIVKRMERIGRDLLRSYGTEIHMVPLPAPDDLDVTLGNQYHRVAVAYGLSQLEANIGRVIHSTSLTPCEAASKPAVEDRDATR